MLRIKRNITTDCFNPFRKKESLNETVAGHMLFQGKTWKGYHNLQWAWTSMVDWATIQGHKSVTLHNEGADTY